MLVWVSCEELEDRRFTGSVRELVCSESPYSAVRSFMTLGRIAFEAID